MNAGHKASKLVNRKHRIEKRLKVLGQDRQACESILSTNTDDAKLKLLHTRLVNIANKRTRLETRLAELTA